MRNYLLTACVLFFPVIADASLYAMIDNGTFSIDTNTGSATMLSGIGVSLKGGDLAYGVVPIPSAVWLFGSGLIGLVGLARRKKV